MMSNWRNRLGSLFLTHRRQLESVVRQRVGSSEAAADIVQDVFTRALVAGPRATVDDERRVLFASARNAAVEHHRSRGRREHLLSMLHPEQRAIHEPSPERGLEAKQALGALDEALAALSPRCRDIFILRRVHGLSNEEVARQHGISINSVEKHIARALRHCQARLSEHLPER
ncbi:RNA polymerase sigma factor [Chelatococcus reniformis]|uniref:DNA-directed RNA polymerase sigma-70 factor n=1 Tax=Chelatococcus reniformis TaxID=1494448 RepID=A0A916UUZ9_9HYPH|nr:sigma-70 family RNA polymerase sigma factor [Chelatococcus reniformis]GGC88956.1 DNA-directed RNA polymerase sigma-70 factor [Chelatococcus reniformis]